MYSGVGALGSGSTEDSCTFPLVVLMSFYYQSGAEEYRWRVDRWMGRKSFIHL